MQLAVVSKSNNKPWLRDFLSELKETFVVGNEPATLGLREKIKNEILPEESYKEFVESDNPLDQVTILRERISRIVVMSVLFDYFKELKACEITLNEDLRLAFDFYGNGILVWGETEQEDEQLEKHLAEIQNLINKKYAPQKLEMKTFVFDKSYGLEFPPEYI